MQANLMNLPAACGASSRLANAGGLQIEPSAQAHASERTQATPPYTIILASGVEDAGTRATLALSMACTALSMDAETHVFLVGKGSYWAYQGPGRDVRVPGFPPFRELLSDFLDLGGSMGVCAACDEARCSLGMEEASLPRWPDIQVQGMASLLARMGDGRVVTF